jgi:hypothetical protein
MPSPVLKQQIPPIRTLRKLRLGSLSSPRAARPQNHGSNGSPAPFCGAVNASSQKSRCQGCANPCAAVVVVVVGLQAHPPERTRLHRPTCRLLCPRLLGTAGGLTMCFLGVSGYGLGPGCGRPTLRARTESFGSRTPSAVLPAARGPAHREKALFIQHCPARAGSRAAALRSPGPLALQRDREPSVTGGVWNQAAEARTISSTAAITSSTSWSLILE